jgi:starch synthase
MKILFAASECVPFIKTGGLADVVGALSPVLKAQGADVRVILPLYAAIPEQYVSQMKLECEFEVELCWRRQYCGIKSLEYQGVTFYFVDNQYYFGRSYIYGLGGDEYERFGFFDRAVIDALVHLDFKPDVIHCHDWQTGLVPVYLHERFQADEFYRGIKTVMTIHNLKFQGIWDRKTIQSITGLSDYYFTPDKLEFKHDASYLKGGLVYADAITTVSNTYAQEIQTPFYGEGLDGLMCARANDLRGIVNGLDYNEWNPETDAQIAKNFNAKNFRKEKVKNKLALQEELGLEVNPKTMMIGIVSRLTDQKGFDLISYMMDEMCQDAVQFVILGTGEERYENMFRHFAWKYDKKVSANIYYSDAMSHKIYASCDAFLMPSLFEPCGLSQLMSLRYGTLPIVRETGGLKDTVEPYNEYEGTGTGFSFTNYNAHEMMGTVRYAERIYYDKKREWNKMIDRAMAQDFSWANSAKQYEEMYNWLIG